MHTPEVLPAQLPPSKTGTLIRAVTMTKKTETVMFEKKNLLRAAIAATLTSGLVACGGGSSGGGSNPPSEQAGQFVDSPVGGLEYTTSSGLSGITNDAGEFKYKEGDEVTFEVGEFNVGKSAGSSRVTPYDLVGNDKNKATNIARFLQSIDDDGIPGNGIVITDSVRKNASTQNSTDVATATLEDKVIASLTSENSVPQTTVVSETDAGEHLDGTLAMLDPVERCGEGTTALKESRLLGNTFGAIKSDEILLFRFASDGTFSEYQYDEQNGGALKDGKQGNWTLSNNILSFGNEPFSACATETSILLENGDEVTTLHDVKPYSLPSSAQSFLVNYRGKDQAILTVGSKGGLDYYPVETPISDASVGTPNSNTGALDLDFDEGGVLDSIYFLAGQGKRTGIYLDYNDNDELAQIGVASAIAKGTLVTRETLADQTFVYIDEEPNEIIVITYNSDGTLEDFNNDCYDDETGAQNACYWKSEWTFDKASQTVTETYSESESATFKLMTSGADLYWAELYTEGEGIAKMHKTKDITDSAFQGSYTIDIPTENTRFNNLVINENGECTYNGTGCDLTLTDGKAELTFDADSTAVGNIWQLAGSSNKFAFVMTHTNDESDIEPGLMTRD